MIVATEVVYN